MTTHSSLFNTMLVPSEISVENILRNTRASKSYEIDRDPPVKHPQITKMSTQPDNKPYQPRDKLE